MLCVGAVSAAFHGQAFDDAWSFRNCSFKASRQKRKRKETCHKKEKNRKREKKRKHATRKFEDFLTFSKRFGEIPITFTTIGLKFNRNCENACPEIVKHSRISGPFEELLIRKEAQRAEKGVFPRVAEFHYVWRVSGKDRC